MAIARKKAAQLELDLRRKSWGGARKGAGRKKTGKRRDARHRARPEINNHHVQHAVLRTRTDVPRLRRRATYDELTSTGEIGLIRDQTLRDLAMRLYTAPMFDSIHKEGIENPYRKAFRMAIPYAVQDALQSACGDRLVPTGDYKAIAHSLDHPCSPGLSPSAMAASAAILRNDQHFLEFLRLRIADIETNLGNLTGTYESTIREPLRRLAQEKM